MAHASNTRPNPIGALMARLHRPVYECRLRALTAAIAPALPVNARVLDVGCGTGLLGRALMDARPDLRVEGLERYPRPDPAVPVTPYDGRTMPFSDGAFDAVIVADVLHHEDDPHRLLGECARVSRGLVIIKDHALAGPLARQRVSFIDWAANAPYGVKCLYQYNTPQQWREWLARHGLRPIEEQRSMNLYPPGLNMLFGRRLQYLAIARREPAAGGPRVSGRPALPLSLIRLAQPHQWSKSVFVLIGPFYGLRDMASVGRSLWDSVWPALLAAAAFALASSACYVVNDIFDRDADRLHPRKKNRPLASGAVTIPVAAAWSLTLLLGAAALVLLLPHSARMITASNGEQPFTVSPRVLVGATVALYVVNVASYSVLVKHLVIADVMSLSMGFVLRVMGGCAAVGVTPTVWLLNVTLFLSMFLAFGKRLGERRTLGDGAAFDGAAHHRPVQSKYTDALLQMMVVVTGVATLMGYAGYIQAHDADYVLGFNLLWLSILPATYCLLRAIVLVERGAYDDPTELATRDPAFQAGAVLFAVITAAVMWKFWGA